MYLSEAKGSQRQTLCQSHSASHLAAWLPASLHLQLWLLPPEGNLENDFQDISGARKPRAHSLALAISEMFRDTWATLLFLAGVPLSHLEL